MAPVGCNAAPRQPPGQPRLTLAPFRALQLHLPNGNQQTEYLASLNHVEDSYRAQLKSMHESPQMPQAIPELDFDTGAPTAEGEYGLADKTYANWVETLAEKKNAELSVALLADINHFYADPTATDELKAKPKQWAELQQALEKLRQRSLSPAQTAILHPAETPDTAPDTVD